MNWIRTVKNGLIGSLWLLFPALPMPALGLWLAHMCSSIWIFFIDFISMLIIMAFIVDHKIPREKYTYGRWEIICARAIALAIVMLLFYFVFF